MIYALDTNIYCRGEIHMALPVALQLYSVRDDLTQDYAGTLKKVKDMGYDYVEFAGFHDKTAQEIKELIDAAGLKAISAHVPYDALMADMEKVLADYKLVGCEYVAIPWLDQKVAPGGEDFNTVVDSIIQIGKAAKAVGLTLLYHNHDFEFRKVGDEYGLDVLYSTIPADLLATEIDTCWVHVAKLDPAEYVRKYKGRAPVVHLKDFTMGDNVTGNLYDLIGDDSTNVEESKDSFDFRPLGQGRQNIPAILEASLYAGAKYVVVEQDRSTTCTPLEAVMASRDYLKSLGW